MHAIVYSLLLHSFAWSSVMLEQCSNIMFVTGSDPGSSAAQVAHSAEQTTHVQVVKAPGNLVISAYVCCPDITLTITPDLKLPGQGQLLHIPLSGPAQHRLGGSALAQVFGQVTQPVKAYASGSKTSQRMLTATRRKCKQCC